jgi:hypothetical protein
MGVSVHVILATIYLQVYGQGLSIHGPIGEQLRTSTVNTLVMCVLAGSMARAVEGMRDETRQVFIVYIVTVFSFAISMISSFWTVMTVRAAAICSAFFLFISYQWWRYCLRIYNKFYVKRLFFLGMDDTTGDAERDPTKRPRDLIQQIQGDSAQSSSTPGTTSVLGRLRGMFGADTKESSTRDLEKGKEAPLSAPISNRDQHNHGTEHWEAVHMQGYLSINESEKVTRKKGGFGGGSAEISESWVRRYFVVTLEGEMFMYKNKFHFHEEPDMPLRSRPIRLCDYDIRHESSRDDKLRMELYYLVLEHKDRDEGIRPLKFKCDSAEECSQWIGMLQSGAALCD